MAKPKNQTGYLSGSQLNLLKQAKHKAAKRKPSLETEERARRSTPTHSIGV